MGWCVLADPGPKGLTGDGMCGTGRPRDGRGSDPRRLPFGTVGRIVVVQREELSSEDLAELLAWLEEAYGDPIGSWRRETWTDVGPGPHFMIHDAAGEILAHACLDWVPVTIGHRTLDAGYLEAVATRADARGKGLGSLVVEAAGREIEANAQIGILGTGSFSFYERLGWTRWTGPTSVTEPGGAITRTAEEDGAIMACVLPQTPAWVRPDLPIRRPRRAPDEPW
jgi:aminoglycoside 2'-N-acetyltransferase I